MLKNSFSVILIVTLCMTCVGRAAVLQDDINAYALWHGDVIDGSVSSPDDTSISGRTAIPLTINGGNAPVTLSAGVYDQALDYGTDGRQMGRTGTTWPLNTAVDDAPGNEIKIDGWFYIPNIAALPMPTTAGGSGAATAYGVQISTTSASGTRCYLALNPPINVGSYATPMLDWQKTNTGSTLRLPLYRFDRYTGLAVTDSNALNLTGKWLHIVAYAQYSSAAPAWDPSYNRTSLEVTDASTATTYAITGVNTGYLTGTGNAVMVGHMPGRLSNTPYRGFRGKIDELKLSLRVHDPMVAYGPTPTNGEIISPSASLTASWYKAAPFNPVDTITQDVWVGLTSAFTDPNDPNWTKVATGITGTTADLGAVAFGNTYYWKVDSIDSGTGATKPSAIWSFAVNDIPPVVSLGLDKTTWLVGGTRTLAFAPTVTDVDTDPSLLTYSWTQIAGPTAAIASPTSKDTDVTFSSTGPCYLKLTVNDENNTVSDVVKVQVFDTPCAAAQATGGYVAQTTDFNDDCGVNFNDFASIAANWAECNSLDPACL